MAKLDRVLVVIVSLYFLIAASSCADKCKKVICQNGGQCYDGVCDCKAGYEGDSCSVEIREKFLGTYNVSDNCSVTGNAHYTVNVSVVENELLEVNITNFNADFFNDVHATIDGSQIEIPPQSPDQDGRSVTGSGIFSGGETITWNYTITDLGNPTNSCANSVWTK